MTKLLTALLLLVAMGGNAQDANTMRLPNYKVVSIYDTTVLYKGDERCMHYVVAERDLPFNPFAGTQLPMYNYGLAGNPKYWLNKNYICTACLYHINIKETRIVKEVPDEYEEALQRLNKIKKQ